MVNNVVNVSAYQGQPPANSAGGRTYIPGGPLYLPKDVLALLDIGESHTILWTRKCTNDVGGLAYDIREVQVLLKEAITRGRYVNSEWCVQKPTGPWAACDAYRLSRDEWIDRAHKKMRIEYYVKFAIGKTGKVLLLVSCHLSP